LHNNPHPTKHSIEDAFDGNLCRCTGYRPILDGAKSLACSGDCSSCQSKDTCAHSGDIEDIGSAATKPAFAAACPFPDELREIHSKLGEPQSFVFKSDGFSWVHPSSKQELVELKNEFPNARIIHGNTEVGIEVRFKNQVYPVIINSSDISELKYMKLHADGVEWGALTTVTDFQQQLQGLVQTRKPHEARGFKALLDNVKYFAGRQIRNVSAIAGNIVTASPISDLNPVFVALGAVLTVESVLGGVRQIPMDEFFLGYRKTALSPSEVLLSIRIPFLTPLQFASAFKQAKRRDDDIAIVNAGFFLSLKQENEDFVVEKASFAYGGMGPFAMATKQTNAFLQGKKWGADVVDQCHALLLKDMPLAATSPGGQIEFRKTLGKRRYINAAAQSFLVKFALRVNHALAALSPRFAVAASEASAMEEIARPVSSGKQYFQESKGPGVVGKAVVHLSATKQVSGEAIYVDDIPKFHNELYGIVVGSSVPSGIIELVDTSAALKAPGVVGYVCSTDLPPPDGHGDANKIGPVIQDEELFATKQVHCVGQMIGMIVAETEAQARFAAKLVKVTYKPLPAVFTIEEAIAADSFFPIERRIETGAFKPSGPAPDIPLTAAVHHVEGVARMSAQEHFYLETNVSLCVPGEDGEMEVYASTQQAKETQDFVAHVVGVPYHKIVVRVKRLGGGFGGKESRSVFLSAGLAAAAKKFRRPVRGALSREEDMVVSGTRHPFRGEYKVGFTDEGRLVSLELDMFANAGYSLDLSAAVLERSMTHCDNAYKIPNVKVFGRLCRTNTATNTAFRGFGGPQGMMVAEQYITHIASYLNKP
ncbi:hypothetical protein HDU91_000901, partial [Kappamyces sp. JEL0680]